MRPGLDPKKKQDIADVVVDEGVDVTRVKGIDGAMQTSTDLNNQIDVLIADATSSGATIPRAEILDQIYAAKKRALEGDTPRQDLARIKRYYDDLEGEWYKWELDTFTPAELQTFKKRVYKNIKWEGKNVSEALNQAKQDVGRRAREELEVFAPEIKDINAREGRLIDAMSEIPQVASKMENLRSLGMDFLVKGGTLGGAGSMLYPALGASAPIVGLGAGLISSIVSHPIVRARNALRLEEFRKKAPGRTEQLAKIMPYLYGQGLMSLDRRIDDEEFDLSKGM